jgi:tellurite resistance protein TerC
MTSIGSPLLWTVFFALVLAVLAVDLGVFHRREHEIKAREAAIWTGVWMALSLGFNLWIWLQHGPGPGLEFLTAYVIEKSLSVDNIFVFQVTFRYFAVPAKFQHRVLFWGILGALVMRGLFVAAGAALVSRFDWVLWVFGAFLLFTGGRILWQGDAEVHPERNPVVGLFHRLVPMTRDYQDKHFFVRRGGKLLATPLLLVLAVLEATDVVFAVDSIPAVFGVTRDPFLVFTSNIFAILGLRALYFLLADIIDRFRYLKVGLGLVLVFIGAKMLAEHWVELSIEWSLGVVLALLGGSIAASLLWPDGLGGRGEPGS